MHLKKFTNISKSESRFFYLLRGGSAILVLLGHIYQLLIQPNFSNGILTHIIYSISGLAVIVFFYLSGLMITLSIYRNTSNYDFKHFDLKKYSLDRLIRLYPPLIASSIIVMIVYSLSVIFNISIEKGVTGYLSREGFVIDDGFYASFLFMQNILRNALHTPEMNGPLWSLSHEFWFYVLAACITCVITRKGKIRLTALAIFVVFFVSMLLIGNTVMFFMGFGVWILGAFTAILRQNITIKNFISYRVMSVLFFVIYIYCEVSSSTKLTYYSKYVFAIAFFFYILGYIASHKQNPPNILSKSIEKSSAFSYTLYVIHWPILMLIYGVLCEYLYADLSRTIMVSIASFIFIVFSSKVLSKYTENKKLIVKLLPIID